MDLQEDFWTDIKQSGASVPAEHKPKQEDFINLLASGNPMRVILFTIPFIMLSVLSCCNGPKGKNTNDPMSYKDTLIDKTFPFIDTLLTKYGEFYPVATAVKNDGTLASVATYDGNERPLSDDVIANLKQALKEGYKKGEYVAGVIFYDVRVIDPSTNEKKDAVAVLYESANDSTAKKYFYPYVLTKERKLSYSEGWNNTLEKEIFIRKKTKL